MHTVQMRSQSTFYSRIIFAMLVLFLFRRPGLQPRRKEGNKRALAPEESFFNFFSHSFLT
jgi:hypothetical protein